MEWWGILIIEKAWLQKLNFKMKFQYDSPPSNSIFKRVGIIHWPTSFIISSRIPSSKLLEGSLIQLPTLEPPQTMGSTDGCWGPNRWRHWPCNIKTHHGIPPFWLAPSNHPFLSGYVIIQNIIGSNKHKFSHWTLDTDVPCAWLYCTMLLHSSFLVLCVACLCISNSNIVLACSESSAHHKFWTEKACYTIVTWSCLKIGYPQIWWFIMVYHGLS